MSSLGGRLREVVAIESSDLFAGQKFGSLAYGTCRALPMLYMSYSSSEKSISREKPVLFVEKISISCNAMMLQHLGMCLVVQFSVYNVFSGRSHEVKNKKEFQTFSSKSGCGRLREVIAYKRFQR